MQVRVAENASTPRTHPALQQVYPPATSITVSGDVGWLEYLECTHGSATDAFWNARNVMSAARV
jgi:hypothetical protein